MLDKNLIKETIEEFFRKMSFDVEVEVKDFKEDEKGISIPVSIKSETPQNIIGYKGETLNSAQFILKAMIKRKTDLDKRIYLNLDVNNYKQKKIDYLRELASDAADDVALIGIPKTLEPMNGEERRAIHMELAERSDVLTESIGERENRRVVIRPAN
jgi:spoIIIJ-associated protein